MENNEHPTYFSFKSFLVEGKKEEYIANAMSKKLMAAAQQDISAQKLHEPVQIVQKLSEIDPTQGKALQFLASQYAKGHFKLEDIDRVRSAIEQFFKVRNQLPQKDLNQFKTMRDLYDAVEGENMDIAPKLSQKKEKEAAKRSGSEVFMKGPNFLVIRLLTGEASCYYASGTKWCTSNPSTFENYAAKGPIYVIIVKDPKTGATRKFQFHYQTGQVTNEKDYEPTNKEIALLSQFPEWYEFIDRMVKGHHRKLK